MPLETTHLELLPYSPEHLLALIDGGDEPFEQCFGLPAAEGLRSFWGSGDISPAWLELLRATSVADPWVHGFAVVDQESRSVIGSAGFKGPPDVAGMVEIGYGILPSHQERGYATEAAAALVAYAAECPAVKLIRAHTLPTSNASMRVLVKCGFSYCGEVVDPDDGLVWRWERSPRVA